MKDMEGNKGMFRFVRHSRICEPYNVCHFEDQRKNGGRYGIQVQLDYGDDQKPDPKDWEGV